MSSITAIPISQITSKPIKRISTGIVQIDWCYDSTAQNGKRTWGLPVGGISLWVDAAGTGKSRLAISVATQMSLQGHRILYAQNEVSMSQFRGWVTKLPHSPYHIHVLDSAEPLDHLQAIQKLQPSLVIIDSISMVQGIERQAKAREVITALKHMAERVVGCHVILIGHLNSREKIKGGTILPHLVDTTAKIVPGELPGWVGFEIVDKHRFGTTGRGIIFRHEEHGLSVVFVGDDEYPMMWLRMDPMTGEAIRRVPILGSGGRRRRHVELDEDGIALKHKRSLLDRLLG